MDIRFEKREHLQEKPDQKNLGFGKHFTDYMFVMDWDKEQGWHDAAIVPYGGIPMDPATMVLHYAQETFEGTESIQNSRRKNPAVPSGNERTPYDQIQRKTLHAGRTGGDVCRGCQSTG